MRKLFFLILIPFFLSCSVSKNYDPNKKYSRAALQEDYNLLRNILEKKHPSLYWYTPRDSMNDYFQAGYDRIKDSMTELQFAWQVLAPLAAQVHCGHTSVMMSNGWRKFIRNKTIPSFPLYMKVWNDTMMVIGSSGKENGGIGKGSFITTINGMGTKDIIHTLFDYMVADGYSENVNYIRLSSDFPYFHRNVFGLYKNYLVEYTDSSGAANSALVPYFIPKTDSTEKERKKIREVKKKISRRERMNRIRSLEYDSSMALLTVNSFSKGHLRSFFKRSFRELHKKNIQNLVIDIRANGGGDMIKSVLLARFLVDTSFRVADSAFAVSNTLRPYTRFISSGFFSNIALKFITHRAGDGKYHFGYWERHVFRSKKRHHFSGRVYVLTNGLTFSAASLFCGTLKGQENVKIIGEETGGGWYGNSGIMIPTITLPHTRLKVRLPFFRLVQYRHPAEKGTGVLPDIYIGPDWRDILNGKDTKVERVKEMIQAKW